MAVESDSQNDTECRCKQHVCGETRVFLTFEKRQDDEQDRGYAEAIQSYAMSDITIIPFPKNGDTLREIPPRSCRTSIYPLRLRRNAL